MYLQCYYDNNKLNPIVKSGSFSLVYTAHKKVWEVHILGASNMRVMLKVGFFCPKSGCVLYVDVTYARVYKVVHIYW